MYTLVWAKRSKLILQASEVFTAMIIKIAVLWVDTMQFCGHISIFERNRMPPSSGLSEAGGRMFLVSAHKTAWRYHPEGHSLELTLRHVFKS